MKSCISLVVAASLLSGVVHAWHLQIHNQIAFMAEELLSPRTLNVTASLLDAKYSGSIGRAAAWADTVRKDKNGATYSYNWHFVGMHESINATNPPSACSDDWTGVCSNGDCVVAQIANQSSILRGCVQHVADDTYVDDIDCQQALMWIVHMIGDVGQPLHTSGTNYGGNGVIVTFNNTRTNLHDVLDRRVLYAGASHPEEFSDQELEAYFEKLLTRIENDAFEVPRKDWINCDASSVGKDDTCAKRWAEDSHALVCSSIYSEALNSTTDLLANGYAAKMFPVVELQLAKAGWRLAAWLNSLVDSAYEDKRTTDRAYEQAMQHDMMKSQQQQVLN